MADQSQHSGGWFGSAPIVVYTLARRFPETINRLPDGRKIPGGPYTLTGFVAGLVLLVAGLKYGAPLINEISGNSMMGLFVVPAAAVGVGVGVSRLPVEGRNPAQLLLGFATAATSPRHGVIDGQPVKAVPTRTYASCVQVLQVPPEMVPAMLRHQDEHLTAAVSDDRHAPIDPMTAAMAAPTKEARRAA